MNARRIKIKILYDGRDISNYVTGFSFTDNTDKTDDVSIKLSDREYLWCKEFFPDKGSTLQCELQVLNWNKENDNRSINLGSFEVDNVTFSESVTVNGVAIPITSSARSEKKTKGWENISLKAIASDISGKASLSLVYETDINPKYDRTDQNNKSDLAFLEELCKSDGLCLKVSDGQLIIFEESKYDTLPSVCKIKRGVADIIGIPSFSTNAKNIYTACEINYFDSKKDKNFRGYFEAPNHINVGHVLKLNESFNSEQDDMGLDRKAKARLREQNKGEWKANFVLKGDIIYFAGINIDVEGWYKFDGKYHIETCTHSIGSGGYSVSLTTRRCLEGY